MSDSDADLEKKIGKRFLVITLDDETKTLEVEAEGFASWELVGIADWLHNVATEDDDV